MPRRRGPPVLSHAEKCTGCLICQLRCSFRFEKEFNLSRSAIVIERLVGAENEYAVAFTPQCDNCGICARFCPYEALVWTKGKGVARAYDLGKVLNAQAGFSRKDDRPPVTWFEPVTRRAKELRFRDYFRSRELTPADIEGFLDDYYQERGYDPETGIPTPQRLAELGAMEMRQKP